MQTLYRYCEDDNYRSDSTRIYYNEIYYLHFLHYITFWDFILNITSFVYHIMIFYILYFGARGGVVVKALRYKPAGRGFDSRRCHWNFLVT